MRKCSGFWGGAFISAEHADAIRAATDGITHRELSEAERTTPQIREVFELLVMQHKNYGKFVIEDHKDWAMARQTCSGSKSYTVRYRAECADLLSWALAHGRRLLGGGERLTGGSYASGFYFRCVKTGDKSGSWAN